MLKPKSTWVIVLIASLVAMGPLSTDMYLPAFPTLQAYFSSSASEIQLTLSVYILGFAVGQLIHGPLSDQYGRLPVLLVNLLLFMGVSLAMVFVTDIETLIVLRFIQAIGGCAGPVLGRAMVRDIWGAEESARVLSYMASAMALAPALAPGIGSLLLLGFGWKAIFLVFVFYALLIALILHFFMAETAPRVGGPSRRGVLSQFKNYPRLFASPVWFWSTVVSSTVFAGLFAFLSGSSFIVIDLLGHSEQIYGFTFMAIAMGYMLGSTLGGRFAQRLTAIRTIGLGAAIAAIAGCAMLLFALMEEVHLAMIIVPQFFYMVGIGLVMPQAMAAAMGPFPHMAGAASSLLGFVQMLVAAIVGGCVGYFYNDTSVVMAGAIAASGVMTWWCYRRLLTVM